MTIEIKVPALPESVSDATIAKWYKRPGDSISRDENLVDLETDKVMLEVPAPHDGIIEKILFNEGAVVEADQVLALIKEGTVVAKAAPLATEESTTAFGGDGRDELSPAVRRMVFENKVDINKVTGTGKGGRITKQDVEVYMAEKNSQPTQAASMAKTEMSGTGDRTEKRVPMSRLRARIAERLVQVQHEAAILTSFNEINMKPVMDLRNQYKDQFEKQHGTRLGFMSFFTKAAIEALKRFPAVNASLDGSDLIYHNYCDIGIAVGSERGLVVPILRNAENMSMAQIEKQIRDYAGKAKDGKIAIEDLTGGTFTITNGGTFGSMMSTPIINAPQTAILGMHNIVERAVVENGQIVARPMMYVALSYDHRVIDGREAVLFLVTIKELIEDPARILLEV